VLLYKIVNHLAVVTTDDILILPTYSCESPKQIQQYLYIHSVWTLSRYGTVYRIRQLKARRWRRSSVTYP